MSTQSLSEHRPVAIPIATDRLPRFQLNTFQLLPLDASWELDLFKRIRSGIMLAQQQTQASEADLRAFRLSLASDIARTYYLIRGNEAEQAVFLRNIATRDSTVGIVRERFRVGLVNQVDVQRAETDLAGLRVQLIGLQRTRAELVNALAQLAAQEPATFNLGIGTLPALPSRPISSAAAPICFRPIGLKQIGAAAELIGLDGNAGSVPMPKLNVAGSCAANCANALTSSARVRCRPMSCTRRPAKSVSARCTST